MRRRVTEAEYFVPVRGFSQAIVADPGRGLIFVSGITARSANGGVVGRGNCREQVGQVIANLDAVLRAAGGDMAGVVQLRTYVVDIASAWVELDRAFGAAWPLGLPASTLVEVQRLFDEDLLVEIDAIATLEGADG